jgi:hypothetical protein
MHVAEHNTTLNNNYGRMQKERAVSDLKVMVKDFFREIEGERIQNGTL